MLAGIRETGRLMGKDIGEGSKQQKLALGLSLPPLPPPGHDFPRAWGVKMKWKRNSGLPQFT